MLAAAPAAMAAEGREPGVRFYKLNKKGQVRNYMYLRHTGEPGCHNFVRTRPVHRFAQTGFEWCQLFAGKDCKPGELVKAKWDGRGYHRVEIDEDEPQPRLYEGSRWVLAPDGNVKVRSWYCEARSDR